ncbi:hypothetical protein GY45DRAFT_602114 [Cubamyces sp. BRFM 1775]|nr:hypothetical protein GY45DRAFT_602114 [Cubamyces sp. BRFM 1775]
MSKDRGLLLIYAEHEVPLTQLYQPGNTRAVSGKLDYFISIISGDLNNEAAAHTCLKNPSELDELGKPTSPAGFAIMQARQYQYSTLSDAVSLAVFNVAAPAKRHKREDVHQRAPGPSRTDAIGCSFRTYLARTGSEAPTSCPSVSLRQILT